MARKDELTYKRWKAMKARCYSPSYNNGYNKYQQLGIQVCDEWKDSYEKFLSDMGECPEGYSLERVNPLRDYCIGNCIWIEINEQPRNRTNSLIYTLNGNTKLLKDWAKEFNISYTTLRHRVVKQGMDLETALKHSNLIEYKGKLQSVKDWCIELDLSYDAVITKKKRTSMAYTEILDYYVIKI